MHTPANRGETCSFVLYSGHAHPKPSSSTTVRTIFPSLSLSWSIRREPGHAGPIYDSKPRLPDADDAGDASDHAPATSGTSTSAVTKDKQSKKRPRAPSLPTAVMLDPVTVRGRPLAAGDRVRGATVSTPPLRKLLFSATLTNNPQKLAGLDVVNPLIYTAREMTRAAAGPDGAKRPSQETRRSNLDEISLAAGGEDGIEGRFSTPATLQETYAVCDSQVRLLRREIGMQQ